MMTFELTGLPGEREGKASGGVGIISLAKTWRGLELFWIVCHASRGSIVDADRGKDKKYALLLD